jgi:phenylalanyl-tRNA synthetase beta chain
MGIKITRSWLDQCVDTNISNQEVGDILTSAGIELDEIIDLKPDVSGVVTGYVKSVSQHPNADRLKVCEVAISDTDIKTIVCGCSTVDAGIHVAVATIGASLPGNFKIKRSKLRGVESEGMLCSMKELGLAAESNGIMHLENVTKLGVDIVSHLNLDDVVFDFDVTPNRGDCLSLCGLARELVAFGDAS